MNYIFLCMVFFLAFTNVATDWNDEELFCALPEEYPDEPQQENSNSNASKRRPEDDLELTCPRKFDPNGSRI